jgi:hypothetical protein
MIDTKILIEQFQGTQLVTATIGVSTNIQSGSTSPTGAPASLMFGVFNYGTHISTTKHRAVWNSITKNRTLTW